MVYISHNITLCWICWKSFILISIVSVPAFMLTSSEMIFIFPHNIDFDKEQNWKTCSDDLGICYKVAVFQMEQKISQLNLKTVSNVIHNFMIIRYLVKLSMCFVRTSDGLLTKLQWLAISILNSDFTSYHAQNLP